MAEQLHFVIDKINTFLMTGVDKSIYGHALVTFLL